MGPHLQVSRIGGGQNLPNFVMGGWVWNPFATQFFFSNGVLLMIVIVALGQVRVHVAV